MKVASVEERENIELKIVELKEDIEMEKSDLDSGYLDPGEEYEIKRHIRHMEKELQACEEELEKLLA